MDSLKDRENAFENQFAHDEEMKFRALARRNKLLGLWAAAQLGKTGADAEAYARDVVQVDFEEVGHEDVFRKIKNDFAAAGLSRSDRQIREMMAELLATAVEQVTRT